MTTINIEKLIELGFNKNEAKVYLSLLKFGSSNANQLIKDTKFHKNIIYDNLEKLIDKGLVTYIIRDNIKIFQTTDANMLSELFLEKEKEIIQKKKLAESLSKEISKIKNKKRKDQKVAVYRGKKGIKAFHNETLKGGDIYILGAPKESVDIMSDLFWDNYITKRVHNKIKVKMIFNSSLKSFGDKRKGKFTEIRYFDKNFEPLTEIYIQDNKVATIVWTEEPILFLIEEENVAKSYKKYFETIWKQAKK